MVVVSRPILMISLKLKPKLINFHLTVCIHGKKQVVEMFISDIRISLATTSNFAQAVCRKSLCTDFVSVSMLK